MRDVGPAVARTRLAGALWVERPVIPAILRVLEVEAAIGGEGRPMAGQTRREHAVEHIHPERYDLQYADGVPYAHEVPRLLWRQHGSREGEGFKHLLARLPDRESPDGVAVEPDLDRSPEALLPQIGIQPALHDPEERLHPPPMRLLAPPRPPRRPPERVLVILTIRVCWRALVEDHRYVRSQILLYPRRQLRSKDVRRAVVDGGELDPLLRDASRLGQREDLVAARVGEDRTFPTHEGVKPACLFDEARARPPIEMIRVPEHDPGPGLPQVPRREPFDRTLRPHGHECWCLHRPARRTQDASARLAVAGDDLYGDRRAYRCRTPPRRSIASPNE